MRTVAERERIDRRLARLSKACKWFRRKVNKKLGTMMLNAVYELWDDTYYV